MIQWYLKIAAYFLLREEGNPIVKKYEVVRLKWAKKYKGWTLQDWLHIIWTDEAMFETCLDTFTICDTPKGYGNVVSILEAHIQEWEKY